VIVDSLYQHRSNIDTVVDANIYHSDDTYDIVRGGLPFIQSVPNPSRLFHQRKRWQIPWGVDESDLVPDREREYPNHSDPWTKKKDNISGYTHNFIY